MLVSNSTPPAWQRWREFAISLAILAMLWTVVGLQVMEIRALGTYGLERDADNLVRSLEQSAVRTVDGADQVLRFVKAAYLRDPAHFRLADWANAYRAADEVAIQLSVIGPDGMLVASSTPGAARVDLSDREHFRVHVGALEDRLFISKPVFGRVSRQWTVQFTRRLATPAGDFAGVLVLLVDTAYLARFYGSLVLGHGTVALVGADGAVRVHAPATDGMLGREIPDLQQAIERQGTDGSYRVRSADGRRMLYRFRTLPGYPLTVLLGLDEDEMLTATAAAQQRLLAAAGGLTALLILVAAFRLRQIRHAGAMQRALALTLDRMRQGVVMVNGLGRVQVLNDRARDLLELTGEQLRRGAQIVDISRRLGPTIGIDASGSAVHERQCADGRAVETELLPLADGGTVLTCTDVSQQRAMAAAQEEALAAAEAANRAKSAFLANMSHEIRTPMNGVLGMIDVMRHSGLTTEQTQLCDTIARSSNALLTVLNDILDYSKLEAGKIVLEPLPCRMDELVTDVVRMMRHVAETKGMYIHLELRGSPPPVLADPTRVRQVLVNLLSNAVKFGERADIMVRLNCVADPEAPDRVQLSIAVRDQGVGIAPQALERLFTRFTQADASSTRRFGGTGLGLVISQELARLMGGGISAVSQPGRGSEFTLRLPGIVTTMPSLPAVEDLPDGTGGATAVLEILVAEDDEINRMVVAAFLEPGGHRVAFAADGSEALRLATGQEFDLILMDVMMPVMDGPTATRRIRELPGERAHVPIIALTANAMSGDRERYLAAGMNAYVSKPIDRGELHRTIERTLGVRAFPRRGDPAPTRRNEPAAAGATAPEPEIDGMDALLGELAVGD